MLDAVNTALGLARLMQMQLKMSFQGGEKAKAAQVMGKLLSRLKVEQDGEKLTATLKADADVIASGLILLPAAIGK